MSMLKNYMKLKKAKKKTMALKDKSLSLLVIILHCFRFI